MEKLFFLSIYDKGPVQEERNIHFQMLEDRYIGLLRCIITIRRGKGYAKFTRKWPYEGESFPFKNEWMQLN